MGQVTRGVNRKGLNTLYRIPLSTSYIYFCERYFAVASFLREGIPSELNLSGRNLTSAVDPWKSFEDLNHRKQSFTGRLYMMTTKIDKSEDELELERLVFGDSEGITQRIGGDRKQLLQIQPTELEHLEDDQVSTQIDRS